MPQGPTRITVCNFRQLALKEMRRQNNCVNYCHFLETEIGIFGRRLHTFREVRLGRIQGLVRLRRIRVKGLKFKNNKEIWQNDDYQKNFF